MARLAAALPVALATIGSGRQVRRLHQTQLAILDLLEEQPGMNHTEICEELGLGRGTGQYHLRKLEDENRIYSVSSGRETHYFRPEVSREEAEKVAALRSGRAMEILGAVEREPGLMQKDLLDEIGMTRKVLRSYVDRLAEEELVDEAAVGRERRYYLTETYEGLGELLGRESDRGASVDSADEL